MSQRCAILRSVLATAVACGGILAAGVARTEAPPGAANGVLVLRNGNVLRGAVRRLGDDYRVAAAEAELQVPAAHVEMFALTLDEAYEAKRRGRAGLSAEAHLDLARWCLRHDLLNHAARELLDARTLDPRHPGVAPLVTQLRELLELESIRNEPPVDAAPVVAPSDAEIADSPEPSPGISLAAQAQFVRKIQPMLINGCAVGGCHQPDSSRELQLDRWALHGNGSAEIVHRNLSSVLAQLNLDDPPSSPLIHWARTAHSKRGGGASRPLAAYQAALLLEWLDLAAGIESAAEEAAGPVDESMPVAPIGAAMHDDLRLEIGDEPLGAHQAPAEAGRVPRDAFDPEVFNRRMAQDTSQAETEQTASGEPSKLFEPQLVTE